MFGNHRKTGKSAMKSHTVSSKPNQQERLSILEEEVAAAEAQLDKASEIKCKFEMSVRAKYPCYVSDRLEYEQHKKELSEQIRALGTQLAKKVEELAASEKAATGKKSKVDTVDDFESISKQIGAQIAQLYAQQEQLHRAFHDKYSDDIVTQFERAKAEVSSASFNYEMALSSLKKQRNSMQNNGLL